MVCVIGWRKTRKGISRRIALLSSMPRHQPTRIRLRDAIKVLKNIERNTTDTETRVLARRDSKVFKKKLRTFMR